MPTLSQRPSSRLHHRLSAGVDVDVRDAEGATPLLAACGVGDTESARLLLGARADARLADRAGRDPLSAATAGGHASVVALLTQAQIHAAGEFVPALPETFAAAPLSPVERAQEEDASMVIARLEGIRDQAELAASDARSESEALSKLRLLVEREASELNAMRERERGSGSGAGGRSGDESAARRRLSESRAARDRLRRQVAAAEKRIREQKAAPRPRGGGGAQAVTSASPCSSPRPGRPQGNGGGNDESPAEAELRQLKSRNAAMEQQLRSFEEVRHTLQRLANEQAFARKRLKGLNSDLSLVTDGIVAREDEIEDARRALKPTVTQDAYGAKKAEIAASVKGWKKGQFEAQAEINRLTGQITRARNALKPFLAGRGTPHAEPPREPKDTNAMGEALVGYLVRAAKEGIQLESIAAKRQLRVGILEEAADEAARHFRALLSRRRAQTMGIESTPRGASPRPDGPSWLPLDQTLTLDQMKSWMRGEVERHQQHAWAVFTAIDEGGSGYLGRKAFAHAVLLLGLSSFGHRQDVDGLFNWLDRHRAGKIAAKQLPWLLQGGADDPGLASPHELEEKRLRDRRVELAIHVQAS